jgi:archaellum component FlaG (FlaF/FlaG flagellin family)
VRNQDDVKVWSIREPGPVVYPECDATIEATVKNVGLNTQTFDVECLITGDATYSDTVTVTDLETDEYYTFTFATCSPGRIRDELHGDREDPSWR